ncbi:hypothetical protein PD716_13970 [Vibrio gigantis]|uniref:DUF6653 family protein n=1 Tax=Vibrio gigantis TaxID=296199 RepID=UPI001BFE712E|nr:DUF6653 family protein [Vibrio gigantis]
MKFFEKMMVMSEDSWARHSNPLSVYTRVPCLSLLSLAIWSREYIGFYSIFLIGFALFWIWFNPRAFGVPKSTSNWASKAVFGERIYLDKALLDIPQHHLKAVRVISTSMAPGLPILFYGLYLNDLWLIAFGNFWILVLKLWFLDRMVWLFDDMKASNAQFKAWEY